MILAAIVVATCASGTANAAGTPVTTYTYTSEQGDYIGRGGKGSYTTADSEISVRGTDASMTFSVHRGDERWSVDLAAPRGERLHPGRYYEAERAAFRTGRAPGLDVSGNGRGCNEVWGRFYVRQIATDSAGNVTMIDASFVQRCEAPGAPRLTGVIKFDARPLSYAFRSEAGDYLGRGSSKKYFGDTSTFSLSGDSTSVRYGVSGQRDEWNVRMQAPTGQSLQPGTYDTARFAGTNRAGLDVSGNGRGCNASTGTLKINDITFDNQGSVTELYATFKQHCDGDTAALRGTIRYYA